jgi:hypothetical protein
VGAWAAVVGAGCCASTVAEANNSASEAERVETFMEI